MPFDPFQGIANILAEFQTGIRVLISAIVPLWAIVMILVAIKDADGGPLGIKDLIVKLIGLAVLWLIAFNISGILCWAMQGMDPAWVCP